MSAAGLRGTAPAKLLDQMLASVSIDTNVNALHLNVVTVQATEKPASRRRRDGGLAWPWLLEQVELVEAELIPCCRATAVEWVLGIRGDHKLRGQWQTCRAPVALPIFIPLSVRNSVSSRDRRKWQTWQTSGGCGAGSTGLRCAATHTPVGPLDLWAVLNHFGPAVMTGTLRPHNGTVSPRQAQAGGTSGWPDNPRYTRVIRRRKTRPAMRVGCDIWVGSEAPGGGSVDDQ